MVCFRSDHGRLVHTKKKNNDSQNCYFSLYITIGIPRTNNSIEAWHGTLKRSIGATNLNIYKFVTELQIEQTFQQTRMAKIDSGEEPVAGAKKYVKMNKRISSIVADYNDSEKFEIVDYLRAIAHNIQI